MTDSQKPDLTTVESPPPRPDIGYGMVKDGEVIGRGGQAIVRRTSLSGSDTPDTVAVKEPQARQKTPSNDTSETFLKEAETWQTLARRERDEQQYDDHIVGVLAVGDTLPWIAMEYMDGGSLADRLDAHPNGVPVDEALWIAECLCKGVKLAHDSGVAHLDLKPSNILFRETPEDTWDVPKIADWGLARRLHDESGSMEAFSAPYGAPEQFDADRFGSPDKYTDLYQVGAVVYELLTGSPPYTGGRANIEHKVVSGINPEPPSNKRDAVPPAAGQAVLRAMSTDKELRYHGEIKRFEEAIQNIQMKNKTAHSAQSLPASKQVKTNQDVPPADTDLDIPPLRSLADRISGTQDSNRDTSLTLAERVSQSTGSVTLSERIQSIRSDVHTE